MKILFVTDSYKPQANGTVSSITRLTEALSSLGHEIYIAGPGRGLRSKSVEYSGKIEVYGLPSLRVPIYPDLWVPLPGISQRSLSKVIEKIMPDIIHVQDHLILGSAALSLAKSKKIPIVGTNHFMPENFLHYLPVPDVIKNQIIRLAWRQFVWKYKQLEFVTTPTTIAAKMIRDQGLKNDITAISNGINLEKFNPRNNGEYLRKKYKLPKKNVLLFVGRLDPEKRLDLVLKALAKALIEVDVHLVIVGRGGYKLRLKWQVREFGISDHVTLTGYVSDEDLPNIFKVADAFVIASDSELQSIATMEAMASGLPVLAANSVALPLLVKNNVNGFLFESGNVDDLARKMVILFKDSKKRLRMGKESLRIILEHDIKSSALKMLTIYAQALEEAKKTKIEKKNFFKNFFLPTMVTGAIVVTGGTLFAFNMPTEIKAAPGQIVSKVKSSQFATRSAETIKMGIERVDATVREISR